MDDLLEHVSSGLAVSRKDKRHTPDKQATVERESMSEANHNNWRNLEDMVRNDDMYSSYEVSFPASMPSADTPFWWFHGSDIIFLCVSGLSASVFL